MINQTLHNVWFEIKILRIIYCTIIFHHQSGISSVIRAFIGHFIQIFQRDFHTLLIKATDSAGSRINIVREIISSLRITLLNTSNELIHFIGSENIISNYRFKIFIIHTTGNNGIDLLLIGSNISIMRIYYMFHACGHKFFSTWNA